MSAQRRSTFRFVLRKSRLYNFTFGLDAGFSARTCWAWAQHVRQRCFVMGFRVGGGHHIRAVVASAPHHEIEPDLRPSEVVKHVADEPLQARIDQRWLPHPALPNVVEPPREVE